jgi:hypothetical protein
MPPISVPQGAQFCGAARERPLMEGVGITYQEIQFGSRYAAAKARVGKRLAQEPAYAAFRHEAQDRSAGKHKLAHSGNIETRFRGQDRRIEGSTPRLIRDIENEVRGARHGMVRWGQASRVTGDRGRGQAPPVGLRVDCRVRPTRYRQRL